jgi:hypothetical protein
MQEKEWTRAFGRCNSWSTRERKSRRGNDDAGRKNRARGPNHPRPVGPGRPAWPINCAPRLPSSAGKLPSPSSVCVLKFLCPEPP